MQHSTVNPAVIVSPRQLQEWINDLPTMNVVETVSMLQESIERFNEQEMEDGDRLKLLDIYREALQDILFSYDEIRLKSLPVSPEQRKHIAEDIMWLYLGLANGYKTIVKRAYDEDSTPKWNQVLLVSIYRAMELIIHALVYAIKAHENAPPLAYLEINQLYLYAEYHLILDVKIKGVHDVINKPTIGNLYKHYVLFNVIDNRIIATEDVLELFVALERFAPHCEPQTETENESIYNRCIDLSEDSAPNVCENKPPLYATDHSRVINIEPAMKAISDWLSQNTQPEENFIQQKELSLLNVFYRNASGNSTARSEKNESREVIVLNGLESIISYFEDDDFIETHLAEASSSGIEVKELDADYNDISVSNWSIINEQDSVVILESMGQQEADSIEVGNLVGFVDVNSNTENIMTGMVRKIKSPQQGGQLLLIEIIPGQPIPFTLMADNVSEECRLGLYYPSIKALNKPAMLCVYTSCYQQDAVWTISINGKSFNITTGKNLFSDSVYSLLGFRPAG